MTERSPSPGELAHYGVKGMKWGVRKARTGQLDDMASAHERIAAGKGTGNDLRVALRTNSAAGMLRRGVKKQSAITAQKNRAEIKRLSTGKAKVGDVLRAYGSANVRDIVRSRSDNNSQEDRIKKGMAKGRTRQQAVSRDQRNQAIIAFGVAGAYAVGKVLATDGIQVINHNTAQRAQRNRQRAEAAGTRGLPRKPTNGPTYAKQTKDGVYRVRSF